MFFLHSLRTFCIFSPYLFKIQEQTFVFVVVFKLQIYLLKVTRAEGRHSMNNTFLDLNGICPRLDRFLKSNTHLCQSSVFQQFLEYKENKQLFISAICEPNSSNEEALDLVFRSHFGSIKLTSYIIKTLHWHAVQYDQLYRKSNERFPLILDRPLSSEQDSAHLLDQISLGESLTEYYLEENPAHLEDIIGTDELYSAYQTLTEYQKSIIEKSYMQEWKDTEIAAYLQISQQAVFKTRKKALDKMRMFMQRRNI